MGWDFAILSASSSLRFSCIVRVTYADIAVQAFSLSSIVEMMLLTLISIPPSVSFRLFLDFADAVHSKMVCVTSSG